MRGLPGQCEVCRQWGHARLCADCRGRFAAPVARCASCALRLAGGAVHCGECVRQPPPQRRAVCVADYEFPWDRLVADFKFHGRVDLAGALAALMAEAAAEATAGTTADTPPPDLVLPVPLAPHRLAERGYNQAWELARRAARRRGLTARSDVLLRAVETAHQADLPRTERLANLRAAFVVDARRRERLQGRRIALVDDVMTTGATVREAAAALLRAGAASVDVWVLARTAEH
jgi:ComF family protein